MQENPLPPPKPPNKEIMEHEQKRKIENQLLQLRRELRERTLGEDEIEAKVREARAHMLEKLRTAPTLIPSKKDTHQAAFAKERHMAKLKEALQIDDKYEQGSAFDLEQQEQKRLDKLAEIDRVRKERRREKREAEKKQKEEEEALKRKELEAAAAVVSEAERREEHDSDGGKRLGKEKRGDSTEEERM